LHHLQIPRSGGADFTLGTGASARERRATR